MSVIKAILFHSNKVPSSNKYKNIINMNDNIDINIITVDSPKIKNTLLTHNKYNITIIPSILILYSNKKHKVYHGKMLEKWFDQLMMNIQQENEAQEQMRYQHEMEEQMKYQQLLQLQKQQTQPAFVPISQNDDESHYIHDEDDDQVTMTMHSAAQTAMMTEHIKGSRPPVEITSEPLEKTVKKEIKSPGLSAMELAKQMSEKREAYDEEIDKKRPF